MPGPWVDGVTKIFAADATQWDRVRNLFVNPTSAVYGAVGDGTTDDRSAIQNALNATPFGGVCWLPPPPGGGPYRTSAPLVVPPGVGFWMTHGERIGYAGAVANNCTLKPLSSFSGSYGGVAGVIVFLDMELGSYGAESVGQRLSNITIEGSALPAGTVHGVVSIGKVRDVKMWNVTVKNVTGDGFKNATYTRTGDGLTYHAYSWDTEDTMANNCGGKGYNFDQLTDSTIVRAHTIGCTGNGWEISRCYNTRIVYPRAEWSGTGYGYHITGAWTGQGSGSFEIISPSTDRNQLDGIYHAATGTTEIIISNPRLRRDGRNSGSGGGGYAGIQIDPSATAKLVIAGGVDVSPGVDDDTTGTNSPQYGLSYSGSCPVDLPTEGRLIGNTAGVNGVGPNLILPPSLDTGTGTWSSLTVTRGQPLAASHTPATAAYCFPVSPDATSTSNTLANGTERATPFYWPGGGMTRIGAEITAAGDVGSTLRLGIRADGAGIPGALILDAGTINANSATVQEITLGSTLNLQPGWYWYTATVQGVTTTQPTVRTATRAYPGYPFAAGTSIPGAGSTVIGQSQTGVTGALGSWGTSAVAGTVPRVFFKVA